MFKKLKSLVLTGIMVMAMAAPAFADSKDFSPSLENKVKSNLHATLIKAGASQKGHEYKFDRDDKIQGSTWEAFIKNINDVNEDGLLVADNNKFYFDSNFNGVLDQCKDKLIATVVIDKYLEDSEKGVDLPGIQPGTGDNSIAVGGAVVAIIAIGGAAYLIFKKDEEDK